MTNARKGDWMQVYGGGRAFPLDVRPEDINIEDIAHSLGNMCRYGGHCIHFYSVAEHSVLLAIHAMGKGNNKLARQLLMHDAPEAYCVDVPRPLKRSLTNYAEIEAGIWSPISERFGLPLVLDDEVHYYDMAICADEKAQNMKPCAFPWNLPYPALGVTLNYWNPYHAKVAFLETFERLFPDHTSKSV